MPGGEGGRLEGRGGCRVTVYQCNSGSGMGSQDPVAVRAADQEHALVGLHGLHGWLAWQAHAPFPAAPRHTGMHTSWCPDVGIGCDVFYRSRPLSRASPDLLLSPRPLACMQVTDDGLSELCRWV